VRKIRGAKTGFRPPTRAEQLKILMLNWKNWLLVAKWLVLGPKGLTYTVDRH
jgi:hypothetical protein